VALGPVDNYAVFMRPCLVRDHGQPAGLAKPLEVCTRELEDGATELFTMDPQIVSVGIIRWAGGYGYRARRHRPAGVTPLASLGAADTASVRGVPVQICDRPAPIVPLLELPSSSTNGSGAPQIPEQARQRPLCPGVQLQNWDHDEREGLIAAERIVVGSLGTLIERDDERLVLSNNHVLAGQNRGRVGDRIAQPGGAQLDESEIVAHLERFVALEPSPAGAHPTRANVIWNRVDAALAKLAPAVACDRCYLPSHAMPAPSGFANPVIGERVFKVGRTTGLRHGTIVSVNERVGPVAYALGDCWFRGSFVVEGDHGLPFSEAGDSGAVVVRATGEVVGLIYAGNGVETYACPITEVASALL
jgi:hypothetical protein